MVSIPKNSDAAAGARQGVTPSGRGAVLHLGIGLGVLAACLAVPRVGSETLLIPLGRVPVLADRERRLPGVAVLRPGLIAGSMVVHSRRPLPVIGLLRAGILAISVPAGVCGAAPDASWNDKTLVSQSLANSANRKFTA